MFELWFHIKTEKGSYHYFYFPEMNYISKDRLTERIKPITFN